MRILSIAIAATALVLAASAAPAAAAGSRVKITGEIIDSWCYLSEIMYPEGTAHHQCAIWCAVGGVPVGILGEDGKTYMVLKYGEGTTNVASPAVLEIQSHKVTVEGDLYERDGVRYLLVDQVVADVGIVNQTHEEYGIQPFGE